MSGAEKLLGAGDMLYLPGDAISPMRIQAPFISENEIKLLVKQWIKKYPKQEGSDLQLTNHSEEQEEEDENDDLYEEVKELVIKTGKASTSYIQRKFKVGYSRAARLMDLLEKREVIGPANGSKPREILTNEDDK